jgi:hypothetical protein
MSNPFSGIITTEFKNIFNNAIDSLLETTALTIPCRLVFDDTSFVVCDNCIFDTMTGRSSNIYQADPAGPIPFEQGICPKCLGLGKIVTEPTTDISMIVVWNYKEWIGWGGGVTDEMKVPFGYVQTFSSLIDTITNIKRAKEILIDTNILPYVRHSFIRISEPNPVGFGSSRYVATMWKRVG